MLFLVAMCATVVVWLWFFPPESLSDRARAVLLTIGCLVTVFTAWTSFRTIDEMAKARARNLSQYRRSEDLKRRAIERLREGEEQRPSPGEVLN